MTTITTDALWTDGEPVYQPLTATGYNYHEPTSEASSTWWTAVGSTDRLATHEVAKAVGLDPRELTRWENATDLAAEADGRDNEGDW